MLSDSVRPLTAAEEADLRAACARIPAASPAAHTIDRLLATLDEARAGSLDAATLGVAMDLVDEEDYRVGVVNRGSKAERIVAKYAALREAQP